MHEHLTGDVREADYLVDLSNVVRMAGSAGPGLYRLGEALGSLIDRDDDPDVVVYLVADRSLPHAEGLPPSDVAALWDWQRAGLVEPVEVADIRLLELAQLTGLSVIANDRYRGYRDEFPWLQGDRNQFIEPFIDRDDRLVLRDVDMGYVEDWDISRHAEQDVLNKQGMLARLDVLERSWRCPDRTCTRYDATRGGYVLVPRIRRGVPTCERHALPLVDDGPRQATTAMKILVEGRCVDRFLVPDGTKVLVGREPAHGVSLARWLDADERCKVSRCQFALSFSNGNLTIRDLSRYGTRLDAATDPEPAMLRKTERLLGLGDRVVCTRRVVVTRSGRRFPYEVVRKQPPHEPRDTETTATSSF